VIIVLTVTQLVFRVMAGDARRMGGRRHPLMRKHACVELHLHGLHGCAGAHGTWVYLWQMFGASNQLMAALSLLVVSVWLKSENRNPTYADRGADGVHRTSPRWAATAITARNLYVTIAANPKMSALPVGGAWAMIAVSVLLLSRLSSSAGTATRPTCVTARQRPRRLSFIWGVCRPRRTLGVT